MTSRALSSRRLLALAMLLCGAGGWLAGCSPSAKPAAAGEPSRALTVTRVRPAPASLPIRLSANGNVTAWQEALIGSQSNGLPLLEVKVNVGDVVRRGQVLALFDEATVQAEAAQFRANLAEAEAALGEATANAARVRALEGPSAGAAPLVPAPGEGGVGLSSPNSLGALSAQQVDQYLTAERAAQARVMAQRAAVQAQALRLAHARVLAPDDGVISSRQATVGAVVPAGQELFRLIRQGRLEWRAEVSAAELPRVRVGGTVVVQVESQTLTGTVRQVAPTVDPATRNALVYVDLPPQEVRRTGVAAGMFARGEFDLGVSEALTLPQTAVMQRDGFSTVMQLGPEGKVTQRKVSVGRRVGDRIEITDGLPRETDVVASGIGFLTDGDRVHVVEASASASAPVAASAPTAAPSARP